MNDVQETDGSAIRLLPSTTADIAVPEGSMSVAMTSFKLPPSLKPMIPICIYIALSSTAMSILYPIIPHQRREYFHSNPTASLWSAVVESIMAFIGLFVGGLFGLAADAYGRKIILLISAWVLSFPIALQIYFGARFPWPFMFGSNLCLAIGSTQLGNSAVGFMVLADLFDKDARLVPTLIFTIMFFIGVICAPIPTAMNMSDESISILSGVIGLAALIFVWLGFHETLPPTRRKKLSPADLHNPLVPLKYVFSNPYLTAFSFLSFCTMYPFYSSSAISMYYLDATIDGGFDSAAQGTTLTIMGVSFLLCLFTVLPFMTKRLHPANVLLVGVSFLLLNSVLYAVVRSKWQVFALLAPSSSTCFLTMPLMVQMVSAAIPKDEQGVAQGTIAAVKGLATVLGPICGSGLFSIGQYHAGHFLQLPFVVSGSIAASGVVVIVVMLKPAMKAQIAAEAEKESHKNTNSC